ncbi:Phage gp6-like head-tail connector protein [Methylorubrum aminovorans]
MSLTVITPAKARDLTTAANARADLGLPAGSPTDDQIKRFIAQASATVASFCRRTFGRETVRERFEIDWRRCRDDDAEGLLLSRAPVVQIASVKVDGLTLAPSAYELAEQPAHPVSLFYLRHLIEGEPRAWMSRAVTVEYEAGWLLPGEERGEPASTTAPDLPAHVERAVIQLVGAAASASGRDMMVKSEDVEGVGSRSFYVQGSTASLPHPEAEATLAQYRRMAFA